jgi:hypothetical protein
MIIIELKKNSNRLIIIIVVGFNGAEHGAESYFFLIQIII